MNTLEHYRKLSTITAADHFLEDLGSNFVAYRRADYTMNNDGWQPFLYGSMKGFDTLEEATLAKLSCDTECDIIEGIGEFKALRLENEKLKAILKSISRQTVKFEKMAS